jgi:hypothetical protein
VPSGIHCLNREFNYNNIITRLPVKSCRKSCFILSAGVLGVIESEDKLLLLPGRSVSPACSDRQGRKIRAHNIPHVPDNIFRSHEITFKPKKKKKKKKKEFVKKGKPCKKAGFTPEPTFLI